MIKKSTFTMAYVLTYRQMKQIRGKLEKEVMMIFHQEIIQKVKILLLKL